LVYNLPRIIVRDIKSIVTGALLFSQVRRRGKDEVDTKKCFTSMGCYFPAIILNTLEHKER
jgi:hypothetical protein